MPMYYNQRFVLACACTTGLPYWQQFYKRSASSTNKSYGIKTSQKGISELIQIELFNHVIHQVSCENLHLFFIASIFFFHLVKC